MAGGAEPENESTTREVRGVSHGQTRRPGRFRLGQIQ